MASLLGWLGKAYDQVNPLDNGRTFKQRTPTNKRSAVEQLTHNGATNVIGGGIVKPLIRGSMALNQGIGNAELAIAGRPTQNAQQYFNQQGGLNGLRKFTGYTGTKRQIAGDAITNTANIVAPGSSKLITAGATKVLPKVLPKIIPKAISGAAVGAPVGAVSNVGSYLSGDEPITRKGLMQAAKQGAAFGAAGGAVLPVVGAAARKGAQAATPAVRQGAQKTVQAAKQAKRELDVRTTPVIMNMHPNERYTLSDFADYKAGRYAPENMAVLNQLQRDARSVAKKAGIDITSGSPASIQQRIAGFLDVYDRQRSAAKQGGYIRLPEGADIAAKTQPVAPPVNPPITKTAVAADPQPPMKQTQTAVAPRNDPPALASTGAIALPNVGKKTRYASKTVPGSEFVSEQVRKDVKAGAPTYDVQTERARYTDSLSRLKQEGDDVFEQNLRGRLEAPNGKINAQDVADGQSLAAILDTRGDTASLQKATEIYERLSEHLTAAGQTVQAAAILSRRTPEGLRYWATKQLKQAGVQPTPELQAQLNKLITATKTATDRDRAIFEVTKLVNDNVPTGAGDKIINLWRAGLLTAPTTTGGNLLGNTGETLVRKGFVNPLAATIDAGIGLFTGKRTQTLAPLGSASKGAVVGAKKLPGYVKTGFDERNSLSKYDTKEISYGSSAAGKATSAYVNGVYRLMSVADQPYWYAARNEALGSIAKAEAINRKLSGAQRTSFINDFMKKPPTDAIERATAEAMYATFQNKTTLGNVASGLKRSAGKAKPVADFFIPFTQVPASIATRIVERTPVGAAANIVKQFVNVRNGGKFDQRALSQAIANGSFGPAVFAAGYSLANSGLLTFGYPKDRKERALWDSEGKQPYSVRVGNRWYSLNYLQPFGTLLAIGGQASGQVKAGASPSTVIGGGVATAGQAVLNQSFLKGIGGALEAVSDPERSAEKYVNNTAASTIPNLVRSAARASDPLQRDEKGLVAGIKQGLPGLREQTAAKNDMFGQPLPAKDNFLNQFVNPLKPSIAKDTSPVVQELRRLQDSGNGIIPTQFDKSTLPDVELTPKQVNTLQSKAGGSLQDVWAGITQDPQYAALSDADKAATLQKVMAAVNDAEKTQYAAQLNISPDPSKLTKEQAEQFRDLPQGSKQEFLDRAASARGTTKVGSQYKTLNSQPGAGKAKARELFKQSGKNYEVVGDTVFRRSADGKVSELSKTQYDYRVGQSTLLQQKNNGDLNAWLGTASKQLDNISKQLNDPSTDPLEAITLQNEAHSILTQANKYKGYGGFAKAKGGRGRTSSASASFKTASAIGAPNLPKITPRNRAAFKAPKTRKLSVSKIPTNYKKKRQLA